MVRSCKTPHFGWFHPPFFSQSTPVKQTSTFLAGEVPAFVPLRPGRGLAVRLNKYRVFPQQTVFYSQRVSSIFPMIYDDIS